MSEYLNQFYNLWILTNLIKVKGTYFIGNFLNGNTRDVDRIIETEGNVISHIYQHISNLVGEPSHIIDNIYLGSAFNVSSLEGLNKFGIETFTGSKGLFVLANTSGYHRKGAHNSDKPRIILACGVERKGVLSKLVHNLYSMLKLKAIKISK